MLVQELITRLSDQARAASESAETVRQRSVDSPKERESKWDSRRFEQDWLSRSFAKASSETTKNIRDLMNLNIFSHSDNVEVGSIVTVREEDGNVQRYFISPVGCPYPLAEGTDMESIAVNPDTPVGNALIGRRGGESCAVNLPQERVSLQIISVD